MSCNSEEGIERLKKALVRIPQLSKFDSTEIKLEHLEKYLRIMCKKHNVMLSYISRTPLKEEIYFSFMIKDAETHEWLKTIYAISMFEGHAKAALFAYAYIKKKEKGKE